MKPLKPTLWDEFSPCCCARRLIRWLGRLRIFEAKLHQALRGQNGCVDAHVARLIGLLDGMATLQIKKPLKIWENLWKYRKSLGNHHGEIPHEVAENTLWLLCI